MSKDDWGIDGFPFVEEQPPQEQEPMADNNPTIIDSPDQDFVEFWRRHLKFFTQGYSPEIRAFEVALCKIEAGIERELMLRKIASFVPGSIYIKAKEDAGYGEAVRVKEERGEK